MCITKAGTHVLYVTQTILQNFRTFLEESVVLSHLSFEYPDPDVLSCTQVCRLRSECLGVYTARPEVFGSHTGVRGREGECREFSEAARPVHTGERFSPLHFSHLFVGTGCRASSEAWRYCGVNSRGAQAPRPRKMSQPRSPCCAKSL